MDTLKHRETVKEVDLVGNEKDVANPRSIAPLSQEEEQRRVQAILKVRMYQSRAIHWCGIRLSVIHERRTRGLLAEFYAFTPCLSDSHLCRIHNLNVGTLWARYILGYYNETMIMRLDISKAQLENMFAWYPFSNSSFVPPLFPPRLSPLPLTPSPPLLPSPQLKQLKPFSGEDNRPVRVMEGLYLGSIAAAKNLEAITQCGITHVINASPIGE